MRVIWTATALADIGRTYQYIEAENPRAAQLVAKALRDLGDSLSHFPHRGRPIGPNLREVLAVYPYIIRYRIVVDTVWIVQVRHGAQRPDC